MSSDHADFKELREAEIARLARLTDFTTHRPTDENGVLLSDRISHYSDKYDLIQPFEPDKLLKPAGYDLTVGEFYSIGGEVKALREGMDLTIEPYQVAVIETYETLNMPHFLVGRWNIRVQWAYKGLLWVGGAQVDPGFRGHLACPIYNLSTKPVTLKFREELAMIDFVTTTKFNSDCKVFDWAGRRKVVFQQYDRLKSGVEAKLTEFQGKLTEAKRDTDASLERIKKENEQQVADARRRVDDFVGLIFLVFGILFAGLGILATKSNEQPDWANSSIWVATMALLIALFTGVRGHPALQSPLKGLLACVATAFILAYAAFFVENNWDVRNGMNAMIDQKMTAASTAESSREARLLSREHRTVNEQLFKIDRELEALRRQEGPKR